MAQQEMIVDYINAYNRFDIPAMLACLTADVKFEHYDRHVLQLSVTGLNEFEQVARQSSTIFSSREQRILSLHKHDLGVSVEVSFSATMAADQQSALIKANGSSEFRFKDGLICEIRDYC